MTAYMIFLREGAVFNPAEMEAYRTMKRQDPAAFKVKPIVVYGKMEALEGAAPDGVVVLEFATMEEARTWYNDPDYQAAAAHRKKAANYRAIIVEGFNGAPSKQD